MPFLGTWKMLAGGSDEPEERKRSIVVTILELDKNAHTFPQKAKDDKGNIYNVLYPFNLSFSFKKFKTFVKPKFKLELFTWQK